LQEAVARVKTFQVAEVLVAIGALLSGSPLVVALLLSLL
jgi:hypothetical protein